jgi:uncharacterized RmlC-like cupin family protein
MITIGEFEDFIHSELVYEQKIISVIDVESRQININNLGELYKFCGCTIKLEQMERYNKEIFQYCSYLSGEYKHNGPVTCHAFRAFENSKSFGMHTDPDDVVIYCIWGKKKIIVNGVLHILLPHDIIYIPANTPHEAINDEESLMLSFGLEKYFIDKM